MHQPIGLFEGRPERAEFVRGLHPIGVLQLGGGGAENGPKVGATTPAGGGDECGDGLLGRRKGLAGISSAGCDGLRESDAQKQAAKCGNQGARFQDVHAGTFL